MANEIDELLRSKKWKKEEVLPKKLTPEEAQKKAEEELERTKLESELLEIRSYGSEAQV